MSLLAQLNVVLSILDNIVRQQCATLVRHPDEMDAAADPMKKEVFKRVVTTTREIEGTCDTMMLALRDNYPTPDQQRKSDDIVELITGARVVTAEFAGVSAQLYVLIDDYFTASQYEGEGSKYDRAKRAIHGEYVYGPFGAEPQLKEGLYAIWKRLLEKICAIFTKIDGECRDAVRKIQLGIPLVHESKRGTRGKTRRVDEEDVAVEAPQPVVYRPPPVVPRVAPQPPAPPPRPPVTATHQSGGKLTTNMSMWQILGVPVGASIDEVKQAFKQRVRQVHPDKAGVTLESRAQQQLLMRAYRTLSNPVDRKAYIDSGKTAFAHTAGVYGKRVRVI